MSNSEFKSLGCSKWLVEALNAMKIVQPTAIQKACIPEILKGRDCIGGANTGSGKTIAFAAPMLTKWSEDPQGMFGIVLTPVSYTHLDVYKRQMVSEYVKGGSSSSKGGNLILLKCFLSLFSLLIAIHIVCLLYTSRCV